MKCGSSLMYLLCICIFISGQHQPRKGFRIFFYLMSNTFVLWIMSINRLQRKLLVIWWFLRFNNLTNGEIIKHTLLQLGKWAFLSLPVQNAGVHQYELYFCRSSWFLLGPLRSYSASLNNYCQGSCITISIFSLKLCDG